MALGDEVVLRNDPDEEPENEEEEEEEEPDLIDPVDDIREGCNKQSECENYKKVFDACQERVNSKSETTENCHEEMIDYIHSLDHCVSKSLFGKLK